MIIALDPSKRSTGWAVWQPGWDAPRFGSQPMGSEYTSDGQCCAKMHAMLSDIRSAVCRFETMYVEKPLTQMERGGSSNEANDIQLKLVAHAESFAYAMGVRCQLINVKSWGRHFIGSMPRGTKSKEKKQYTIERCHQLGWKPRNTDEADALGLLDYSMALQGLQAPWLAQETLRAPLMGVTK